MISLLTTTELCLSCLSFTNNYFDKAVVIAQDSFPRDISDTYFKNSLQGYFGNLNFIYTTRGEAEIKKDCLLILGYEVIFSRTFL